MEKRCLYGTLIAIAFVAVAFGFCVGICSSDCADAGATFTVEDISDVTYSGHPQKQTPIVRDSVSTKILTSGTDYIVTYSDDVINAGTVTVTVTGKGIYLGNQKNETYEIKPATITGSIYQSSASPTYDGKPHTMFAANTFVSVNNQKITVTYCATEDGTYTSSIPAYTDAGDHTVYYKANAPNHYEKTGTFTVTIKQRSISDAIIILDESPVYNGTEQTQTIASVKVGTLSLVEGVDYTVSDNTATHVSGKTMFIFGIGNFTGNVSKNWSLKQATQDISYDVTKVYKSKNEVFTNPLTETLVYGYLYYTTKDISIADVNIYNGEVTTYTKGITVITAAVEGNTDYTSAKATYMLYVDNPPYTADMFVYIPPSDTVYDGHAKSATVVAKSGITGVGKITVKYYSDSACTIEVPSADVKNAATYYVAVDVEKNPTYCATEKVHGSDWNFTITKAGLAVTANEKTIGYGDDAANNGVTYTGFVNNEDASVLGGTLEYVYTYDKTDASKRVVGMYLITPSGLTSVNYNITFNSGMLMVTQKQAVLTWTGPADHTYDGSAKILSADVSNKAYSDEAFTIVNTLTAGDDNVNVGKFTYTVSDLGNDNYIMPATTVSQEYEITKKVITVSADELSKIFSEADPEFTYTYSTAAAGETPAFTGNISRDSGEDADAYLMLAGTLVLTDNSAFKASNYDMGMAEKYFTILSKPLLESYFTVELGDETYDGTAKTKTVTSDLVEGTDYTVGYIDNIRAGTATIYISGSGNYGGTLYYHFTINKLGIDMPEDQYYIETGSVIDFDLVYDDAFLTETSGRPHYGIEAGTYPFTLTPNESCFWNDETCTGAHNVYITLKRVVVTDEDDDAVAVVTGSKGIRKDILISIIGTDDVSSVKKALESVDGTPKYKYTVKFQIDGEDVIPEGRVIITFIVPDNVRGQTYDLYSVTDGTASELPTKITGMYLAAFPYEGAPEYAFVVQKISTGAIDLTYFFIFCLIIDVIISLYLLATRSGKRKTE